MRTGGQAARSGQLLGIIGVVAVGITASYAQQIWAGGYGGQMPPRLLDRHDLCRQLQLRPRHVPE